MPRYTVQYRISDNVVEGTWQGSGAKGIPLDPPGGPHKILEVTEAEYTDVHLLGTNFKGSGISQFKVVSGVLVKQTDPRPKVRFTPTRTEVDVGDTPPTVQMEVLNQGGQRDPTVTKDFKLSVGDEKFLRVSIVSGVANLTVATDKSQHITLRDTDDFIVEAPMDVRVYSTQLD